MGKEFFALAWLVFASAAVGADNARTPDAVMRQLEKLLHDEQSGAAQPLPSPFWGEGGRIPAREQRKRLVEETFAGKGSPELIPVIDWVLEHERLVEPQTAAARMLRTIEGEGAERLVQRLLREPHPASEVVAVLASRYVQMAGAREEVLEALASHPLPQVRSVARSALTTRGRAIAPFDEASLITPRLRASLASVLSLPVTPVSTRAKLVEIDLADQSSWGRERSHVRGFLIAEGGGRLRLLSSHFEEREMRGEKIARRSDVPVSEEVARVTKLRGSRDGASELSSRGSLTAQFEPRFVSGWEVLLGAWLVARGDLAMAGRLLAPVLEQCPDERFLYEVARDQWATRLLHAMLEEFSEARDRTATLKLARHLAERFAGHPTQRLAAKLVRELTAMETGPKLVLPAPDAWKKLAGGMSRAQKLEYLLDRLVLLNCVQRAQPGGVSFRDPQFQEPVRSLMRRWRSKELPPQLINPFVEIQGIGLNVADVPLLASRLHDDRYIPTFGFWRDFHPSRHLYTVTEVVGELIDEIARTQLAHAEDFLEADAEARKASIERIVAWSKANASLSETDRLIEIVRTSRFVGSMYYDELVKSLEKLKAKQAAPVLLGRLADKDVSDYDIAYLLNAANRLDAQTTVATASKYLDHAKPGVRLAAGCVVYQHGDRAAGRRAVAGALARGTYSDLGLHDVLAAVRALVAVGGPEDLDAARVVFNRDYFEEARESDRAPVVAAFGDKGGPGLYAFYLRQIGNTRTDGGSTSYQEGKPPQRRTFAQDAAREFLQSPLGKRSGIAWPADETESAKFEVMRQLKVWLEERR